MKIGILGGGQLAQMIALAGIPMGYRFVFYDPAADCCSATLGEHFQAAYDDWDQLAKFADCVDIITYEFENIPLATVNFVAKRKTVLPEANALDATQDRLVEKRFFRKLGIPTTEFIAIESSDDLIRAGELLHYPYVLKSRFGGYDGKGQYIISSPQQIDEVWQEIANQPFLAEAWVDFNREVSLVAVRKQNGETAFYDITENTHQQGILRMTFNQPEDPMLPEAQFYVQKILDALNYCGIFTLEFFQVGDKLTANEYAPRVHNSGHWSIEGAISSQFENHLRAILDLPLGSTLHLGYCAMLNFIGTLPDKNKLLAITDCHYHDYGKQPKPGRKLGHLTLRTDHPQTVEDAAQRLLSEINPTKYDR